MPRIQAKYEEVHKTINYNAVAASDSDDIPYVANTD